MKEITSIKKHLKNLYQVKPSDNKFTIPSKKERKSSRELVFEMFKRFRTADYISGMHNKTSYKTAIDTMREAMQNKCNKVYKTDINNFYNNITMYHINRFFISYVEDFAEKHSICENDALLLYSELFYKDMLVPGYPHSGFISSVISASIHHMICEDLESISKQEDNKIYPVMYADDIIIFHSEDINSEKVSKCVNRVITRSKFMNNKSKTKFIDLNKEAPIFLGVRILIDKPTTIVIPNGKWKDIKRTNNVKRAKGLYAFAKAIYRDRDTRLSKIEKVVEKIENNNQQSGG